MNGLQGSNLEGKASWELFIHSSTHLLSTSDVSDSLREATIGSIINYAGGGD